jgi:hypothetical protein
MRGGFARPVVTRTHALPLLPLLLLLALSGCSLFRSPPPEQPEAPVAASEPEQAASEPEAASAPEAASEPEETAEAKPAPKKPHPPIRRRRPAPPPPAPPSAPAAPAPAPLVSTRTLERGTFRTLLDSEVQKTDGKVVGRAVDLVAGPGGKPVQVVVNLQGFMGVGDRKAWFPWSDVRINTQPKTPAITLALAPGQQPAPDRPAAGGAQQPAPDEAGPTRLPMLDASIERANGAKVGRVVDVLLDGSADPLAVVLDVSGTLEKRQTIAAEWTALHFVTKNHVLTAQLEMSDQQIDASPRYASEGPVHAVKPNAPPAPAASAAAAPPAAAASSHGAQ